MRGVLFVLFMAVSLTAGTKESFDLLVKRIQKEPAELAFSLEIFWAVREKTEKKKGTLIIADNNRFDLSLGSSRWTSDGVTLWQFNSAQQQLVIRKFAEMDLSMHPSNMFDRFAGRQFKIVKAGGQEILRWKGEDKEYQRIDVKLSSDGKRFDWIVFVDNENNQTRYRFSKMVFLKSVDANRFKFIKPAGAEVLDER